MGHASLLFAKSLNPSRTGLNFKRRSVPIALASCSSVIRFSKTRFQRPKSNALPAFNLPFVIFVRQVHRAPDLIDNLKVILRQYRSKDCESFAFLPQWHAALRLEFDAERPTTRSMRQKSPPPRPAAPRRAPCNCEENTRPPPDSAPRRRLRPRLRSWQQRGSSQRQPASRPTDRSPERRASACRNLALETRENLHIGGSRFAPQARPRPPEVNPDQTLNHIGDHHSIVQESAVVFGVELERRQRLPTIVDEFPKPAPLVPRCLHELVHLAEAPHQRLHEPDRTVGVSLDRVDELLIGDGEAFRVG